VLSPPTARVFGVKGQFSEQSPVTKRRLPNAQGEMVIEFSGNDLVCGRRDQFGFLFWALSQIIFNKCRSLLQNADSPNQFGWYSIRTNVEMN
jgi:hypothetical protein